MQKVRLTVPQLSRTTKSSWSQVVKRLLEQRRNDHIQLLAVSSHTSANRNKLVLPGCPNGMPAVMAI